MRRKFLTAGIILLFFATCIIPAIAQKMDKSWLLKDNLKNSEKTEYIGKIYGYTYYCVVGWSSVVIQNAFVRVGSKITKSNRNGYYEITGLQINRTYKVVVNHFFYIRTVKKVTLTTEKPEKNLIFYMESILDYIYDFLLHIIKFLPQGVNVDKS